MAVSRRQFLKGSALAAGALLVPWPTLTAREPFFASLHSSIDGEIARVRLSNVYRVNGRWDAADCWFYAVMGYPFDQVRVLGEDGQTLGMIPVDRITPNGGDVHVVWQSEGLPYAN